MDGYTFRFGLMKFSANTLENLTSNYKHSKYMFRNANKIIFQDICEKIFGMEVFF